MIEGAPTPRAQWQKSLIVEIVDRTPSIKSFFLRLSAPFTHQAGQHVDVRLTAPDGYVAMRSYSIASAPSSTGILELAIERLPTGEVSPFFHDVAQVGDEIELRGPLGGHFIWPGDASGPVLLIGAGSGVAPLAAMVRYRRTSGQRVPTALLMSARTRRDTLFGDELVAAEESTSGFSFALALTREPATRGSDFSRRIDAAMIGDVVARLPSLPEIVFVCGSNTFVNVAVDGALTAGIDAAAIKTERYGA
ncbi:oxidoreductase [Rhizobium leguminosarum]|uniref:ferredoxin reductase n=1 Tax=Rhizobium ruizarguesonis TaxID=2081791 RepID=UPI0014144127|nr:ferredoxin reductase [Rhizobium ruizarguesonis]NEJ88386.1 oxidoreductase [Rhizobium ruizarguesonis]